MATTIQRTLKAKHMVELFNNSSDVYIKFFIALDYNDADNEDPEKNYLYKIEIRHPEGTDANQIFDEALKKIQTPEPDPGQPAQPYRYTLPTTNSLYTSFDIGEVIASSKEEARAKAIEELDKRFQDVNYWLSVHFLKQGIKIFHNTEQLLIEEAHPDPDYADNDEPFNYKDYLLSMSNEILIFSVECKAMNDKIKESDWPTKYYATYDEATRDYNRHTNIGYKLELVKHHINVHPNNLQTYSECTSLEEMISTAKEFNEYSCQHFPTFEMTGRHIQDNAIIIVTDMDNNLVDIRPPFRHELWESDLINDNDDCHYRHLLHHTADDTETAIIEDIYDHFIAAYGGGDMTKEEWYVFINLMMIRNFHKD